MAGRAKPDDIQLTKRQRLLFERLVTLGDLAKNDCLPVRVTSIKGLGSFFRGKRSPKDADVLIQHANDSPQFDAFIKIKKKIDGSVENQQRFLQPVGAFLEVFDRLHADMLPGFDQTELRQIFASWLEGWSWEMLYPGTMNARVATNFPTLYLQRFLRRTVPNINSPLLLGPNGGDREKALRTGFLVEIWTPERCDMRSNLIAALAPGECERYVFED